MNSKIYSFSDYERDVKKRQKGIRNFDKKQRAEMRKLKRQLLK